MCTAPGVPVEITSPGYSGMTWLWKLTSCAGPNIMLPTTLRRWIPPLWTVATSIAEMSPKRSSTSAIGTICGPKEKKPGKFFARVRKRGLRAKMSSAVWSRTGTTPQTKSSASSTDTSRQVRPMTRPSSASAVVRSLCQGTGIGSSGPMTVWSPFKNEAGSSPGATASRSAAWLT
jgi:hypothetical protein